MSCTFKSSSHLPSFFLVAISAVLIILVILPLKGTSSPIQVTPSGQLLPAGRDSLGAKHDSDYDEGGSSPRPHPPPHNSNNNNNDVSVLILPLLLLTGASFLLACLSFIGVILLYCRLVLEAEQPPPQDGSSGGAKQQQQPGQQHKQKGNQQAGKGAGKAWKGGPSGDPKQGGGAAGAAGRSPQTVKTGRTVGKGASRERASLHTKRSSHPAANVVGKQGASTFKGEGKGHPSPAVRRQIHSNHNQQQQQQHGKHRRSRSLRTTGTKATRGTSCSASRTQSTASRQSSQRTRGRFGKSGHRGRSGGGKHSRHNRRKKKSRPASAGKQQQPGENTLLYKQSVQYYKQFLKSIHSVKSVSEYFNSKTAKSGEGRP